MEKFESADAILDFAIQREQEAQAFYRDLAEKVKGQAMQKLLMEFVAQETRHEAKLKGVKQGRKALGAGGKVPDLKVSQYLAQTEPKPDMDYQDALTVAMQRERAAFALYTDLAAATDDAELQDVFNALAQEEAKHKLFLEREYDDHVYSEN
jgi:rubrerythrin